VHKVTSKVAEMILDDKIQGTLDQGNGILELWETKTVPDQLVWSHAVESLDNANSVLDLLAQKASVVIV